MDAITCADPKCRKKFRPVAEWQEFCSKRCSTRVRVARYRARKLGGDDDGGGRKGQRTLFSRSELHRRKPAKAALVAKPKQDDLFPPQEGRDLLASFGGAVEYGKDGSVSDKNKYYVKSSWGYLRHGLASDQCFYPPHDRVHR